MSQQVAGRGSMRGGAGGESAHRNLGEGAGLGRGEGGGEGPGMGQLGCVYINWASPNCLRWCWCWCASVQLLCGVSARVIIY